MIRPLLLWLQATRARFFTASLVPVLVGASIAYDDLSRLDLESAWSWGYFLVALSGVLFAQAGANLVNDYGDHLTRNDELNHVPSPFNGGSRVIQARLIAPSAMLLAGSMCFAATIVLGLYLNHAIAGNPLASTPVLWAGVAGCALGATYTLGPLRLSYRGLGEIAIALGFGPVIVLGTHYVLTAPAVPDWQWARPLVASIPIAIFVMLIVWINQFQDAPADAQARKRTWVVRLCEQPGSVFRYERAFTIYRTLNVAGFLAIASLGALGLAGNPLGHPYAFLALLAVPLFFRAGARARSWLESWNASDVDRRQLAYALLPVNALTGAIHLLTGLLLGLAYALAVP